MPEELMIDDVPVTPEPEAKEPEAPETEAAETEEAPKPETEETKDGEEEEPRAKKPEFTPEQQEFINKINSETAGRYLKRLEAAEKANQELQQRVQQFQPQEPTDPGKPVIPPLPDPYDDDYGAAMEKYTDAVRKAAAYDVRKEAEQAYAQQQQAQRQQAVVQELTTEITSYTNRAKKAGISETELKMAGSLVTPELSPALIGHILTDDKGPQMTKYLAANPSELDKLKGMTPTRAAVYLETTVKPKAVAKPVPTTPKPTDSVDGTGFPPGKLGGKGLVIE